VGGDARAASDGQRAARGGRAALPDAGGVRPRWMDDYAHANQNKPRRSTRRSGSTGCTSFPVLGKLPLNQIGKLEIQRVKKHLQEAAPKTVACVLSQLATMLRTAEEWEVIVKAPKIELPRIPDPGVSFYDFEEWEALIDGARRAGPMVSGACCSAAMLGCVAASWSRWNRADSAGHVHVVRNEWMGEVGAPKGGKARPSRSPRASRKPSRKSATSAASASSGKPTGSRSGSRR
jgi:hypothetical protein